MQYLEWFWQERRPVIQCRAMHLLIHRQVQCTCIELAASSASVSRFRLSPFWLQVSHFGLVASESFFGLFLFLIELISCFRQFFQFHKACSLSLYRSFRIVSFFLLFIPFFLAPNDSDLSWRSRRQRSSFVCLCSLALASINRTQQWLLAWVWLFRCLTQAQPKNSKGIFYFFLLSFYFFSFFFISLFWVPPFCCLFIN